MDDEHEFIINKSDVLLKYNGEDAVVDIPEFVKVIGPMAFNENANVEVVHIPAGVTEIGFGAFNKCSKLKDVKLPEDLKKIGDAAFAECTSLKSIRIPEGVTEIGKFAFANCCPKSLFLPASLKTVGEKAFICPENSIESLYIANIAAWCNIDFADERANPMYSACKLYVKGRYTQNIVIPDTVCRLKDYVFNRRSGAFSALAVPESVTEFSEHIFLGPIYFRGKALEEIPEEYSDLKIFALAGFAAMYEKDDPDRRILKSYYRFLKSEMYAFGLDFIFRHSAILYFGIKYSAFKLEDVEALMDVIPEKQSVVDHGLLIKYSNYLKGDADLDIDLDFDIDSDDIDYVAPREVAKEWRFRDTDMNSTGIIRYTGTYPDVKCPARIRNNPVTSLQSGVFDGCEKIESIELPDTVNYIGAFAFNNCSNLRKVNIPKSLTCIKEGTFSQCSSLETITIPESVTEIQTWAFRFCDKLRSVEIPDSVKTLEGWLFYGCIHLKEARLPAGMQSIGAGLFCECFDLESVNIPDGVKKIEERAFKDCRSLKTLALPDGLTVIDKRAFEGCSELCNLTIPDSVKYIVTDAFKGCDKLSEETKRKIQKLSKPENK